MTDTNKAVASANASNDNKNADEAQEQKRVQEVYNRFLSPQYRAGNRAILAKIGRLISAEEVEVLLRIAAFQEKVNKLWCFANGATKDSADAIKAWIEAEKDVNKGKFNVKKTAKAHGAWGVLFDTIYCIKSIFEDDFTDMIKDLMNIVNGNCE